MRRQGSRIPYYDRTNQLTCYLTLSEANDLFDQGKVDLSSKGSGNNYRITALHEITPPDHWDKVTWRPLPSGEYIVMQMQR